MKNIVVFPSHVRFPVKLICRIAFGSASSTCCLLKYVVIILWCSYVNMDKTVNNWLCNYLLDLM